MKKEVIFISIFALSLFLIPLMSAVTIQTGTLMNTSVSHSAISFDKTITATLVDIKPTYIYLQGIRYITDEVPYTCSKNHTSGNTIIHSSTLCSSSSDDSSGGGGGGYTDKYILTAKQLQEGYSGTFKQNNKIQFEFENKTILLTVQEVTWQTLVLDVNGKDYTLNEDSIGKIDLNDDGFYDLKITSGDAENTDGVFLEFKLIHEEIPSQKENEKESPVKDFINNLLPGEISERALRILVIIFSAIILFVVLYFALKGRKKK